MANKNKRGTIILIGGREDKLDQRRILAEVAKCVGNGKLCIATVASKYGSASWKTYRKIFRSLGVKKICHLDVVDRSAAAIESALKCVTDVQGIFFTGGDQLKITSELGGTAIVDKILEVYEKGGVIAGTSAGASVMSETMLVSDWKDSTVVRTPARMAPGLGIVQSIIIDQHFAERGRIARLLEAIAQNPKYLGFGIDEDTALISHDQKKFQVLGKGSVYVLDAHESVGGNVSSSAPMSALSLYNIKVHILSDGDVFNIETNQPERCKIRISAEAA